MTKAVHVSRTERTRFTVSRTDNGTAGTVIIGSDDIAITLTAINAIATTGQMISSPAPQSGLSFGSLLNNFTVGRVGTRPNC